MSPLSDLLEQADAYCDLRQRLELVPTHAKARGVVFRSIEVVLEQAGLLRRYRELFPKRQATVLWYPAEEFLEQLVVAAILLKDPSRVHEGMFEIGRANARVFAESVLGQLLVRSLSRIPQELLQQAVIGHRQCLNHGSWQLTFPDACSATMQMSDEYFYIDSYLLGAAYGTFQAIEVPVQVQAQLEGPFHGRHLMQW